MSTSTTKTLRQGITKAKGVKEGTVVTFTRHLPERRDDMRATVREAVDLNYAALFVAGKWHFTGRGSLGNSALSHQAFLERMAEPDISEVRVAVEYEEV